MRGAAQALLRIAGIVAVLSCFAIGAAVLVPSLLGFERYVVVSGSMTGTYDTGSLVYSRPVPVRDLSVGDVITYRPPKHSMPLTHRIVWRGEDRFGRVAFKTKGDANSAADHWRFVPETESLPRAEYGIPHLGRLYAALSLPVLRLVLIVIPAALLAVLILASWWREAGEHAARARHAVPTEAK